MNVINCERAEKQASTGAEAAALPKLPGWRNNRRWQMLKRWRLQKLKRFTEPRDQRRQGLRRKAFAVAFMGLMIDHLIARWSEVRKRALGI